MKKQINPTIKAHLIRGASYLVLLVAVCAIPFALAQHNTTEQSAPTLIPTATATPTCAPIVVMGSISRGDPMQTDRLNRSGIPQTCPASTTCSIFGDAALRRYDAYTFTNTTGSTQCVTIDTT